VLVQVIILVVVLVVLLLLLQEILLDRQVVPVVQQMVLMREAGAVLPVQQLQEVTETQVPRVVQLAPVTLLLHLPVLEVEGQIYQVVTVMPEIRMAVVAVAHIELLQM